MSAPVRFRATKPKDAWVVGTYPFGGDSEITRRQNEQLALFHEAEGNVEEAANARRAAEVSDDPGPTDV